MSGNNSTIEESWLPVVEQFYSIQGEGYHSGKAAYFLRLGGCDIGCSWCDTKFSWNPEMHPHVKIPEIIENISGSGTDSVVVTGGEPLMWNLDNLCTELKRIDMMTFLETSGAYPLTGKWDWICLSPKINNPPLDQIINHADELKVIIQERNDFEWAEKYRKMVGSNCRLYLQPEWSRYQDIIPEIVEYVKTNKMWEVSLQAHKFMQIP